VQDEEQEAQEARLFRELGNSSRASGTGSGSLITEIRNPAAVNASVIACSGRFRPPGLSTRRSSASAGPQSSR
jgi:hypothetical protein